MAVIFKNPQLTDYFVARPDVTLDVPADSLAPITEDYEAAKVIAFPNLKLSIDHDFWSGISTDEYPILKKMSSVAPADPRRLDSKLEMHIANSGVPQALADGLRSNLRDIYAQILPIYGAMFADYQFASRRATWRLNTIRNENLHLDAYRESTPTHLARMFINLDNQPRIWSTSYTAEEVSARFGRTLDDKVLATSTDAELWARLNGAAFGSSSKQWWDNQPRHWAYFDPGEVWAVDSRQVAHQIFYGRRAVSIDFAVNTASMTRQDRHYLKIASAYRDSRIPA